MKTNAKQTAKWIGTTSLMVLGILFLTVLPLNNIEAGNFEKSDCHSSTASNIAIEAWMLNITDWNSDKLVAESHAAVNIEPWMLAPEFWNNEHQADFAEVLVNEFNDLDVWMFEPEEWDCDMAGLRHGDTDRDYVMIPFYF